MGKNCTMALCIVLLTVLSFKCSKDEALPRVLIVVGDNVECRNNGSYNLVEGHELKENDTIIVPEDSKVKISFNSGAIYLNGKSSIKIGSVVKQDGFYRLTFHLLNGELFFTQQEQSGKADTYLFVAHGITATGSITNLNIKYDKNSSQLKVIPLSGSVLITSQNSEERFVASCNRFMTKGAEGGCVETVNEEDIAWLRDWVGKSTIDAVLSLSRCSPQSSVAKNLSPEWIRLPDEVYMTGELVIDTVLAVDPENGNITYELLSGPEGMTIDQTSGEIRFKPSKPGSANVTIRATDSDLQISILDHVITVSKELAVVLSAPHMVKPGEFFGISASPPKNSEKKLIGYTYRFDCNGDGIFEFPGSGKFGTESRVKRCSISNEGIYLLKVEVKNSEGKTASSTRKIIVNQKPTAVLKVTPSIGTMKTDYLLDAGASSDTRDSSADLMVRFDIDNDGQWDIPSGSGFLNEKRASCNWNESGAYRVVAQVIDKQGMTDTASAEIIVSRGLHIDYITCPDTVHVGDTIRVECKITPSEFPIVAYKWSFDTDTGLEVSTNKPVHNHVFRDAGVLVIRCRVVDEKGLSVTQQKKVIIVNNTCSVEAGGPYKTNVNMSLNLEGFARDSDNKIVKYWWDFDNDGKADWTSEKTGKTTYSFSRSGKKRVFLFVETDDGSTVTDSAFVQVTNNHPIAKAGEDIVSRNGKKVKLNGTGEDPDGKILLYRWDFDNDGKIDWSSAENGFVEREFQSYTTAVFSVIDSDSSISYDSMRIIICPEGMQTIENGMYCIDTYEYPNKKGEEPEMNVSYEQAREKCKQEGKRLCSAQEWEIACRNEEEKFNYPYGKSFIRDRCNTLGNPVLKNKVSASGAFYDCHGNAGVFDMSGNVAEWTERVKGEPNVYGGSWQSGENTSSCDSKLQLQGGRKYFYVGFRCCK